MTIQLGPKNSSNLRGGYTSLEQAWLSFLTREVLKKCAQYAHLSCPRATNSNKYSPTKLCQTLLQPLCIGHTLSDLILKAKLTISQLAYDLLIEILEQHAKCRAILNAIFSFTRGLLAVVGEHLANLCQAMVVLLELISAF